MKNRYLKLLLIIGFIVSITLGAFAFSFRNMTLDFVHISDTHITSKSNTTYKMLGNSKALLVDAVEQINKIQGLDFVMFGGDNVDTATEQNYLDFYKILSKLRYPSLNAFGSHDYAYGELDKERVLELTRQFNPNYTFADTYYAISPKTDYRIIVLDPVIMGAKTSNGEIPAEQLAFLDNELMENQDKVVVIVMHYPSVEPFVAKEHSLLNANEFNELILKYRNPIVVLTGHYHAAKIRHWGNLLFISTPSMVTYPMAFRHIKITNFNDRVKFEMEMIPTRLDDIKEENRQGVISYGTLAGLEADRNLTYTFKKNNYKSVRYKRNKIKNSQKITKTSRRELKKLTQPKKVKSVKNKDKKVKKSKKEKAVSPESN